MNFKCAVLKRTNSSFDVKDRSLECQLPKGLMGLHLEWLQGLNNHRVISAWGFSSS